MKYDDEDCLFKAKGSFKIFEHNNKRNKSYSLGLRIDKTIENGENLWKLRFKSYPLQF